MAWVKLDDGFPDHRKMLEIAERCGGSHKAAAACWLWACGIAYCNRQKARDGFIPSVKVGALYPIKGASDLAQLLVDVNLWERVEGGYQIHDYHDYQPTAEKGEATSEARREAGRRGGKRSGEARRQATGEANTKQPRSKLLEAKRTPDPTRPVPEEHPPNPPAGGAGEGASGADAKADRAALVEHVRSEVATPTRAATAMPPGDLVVTLANLVEQHEPDPNRQRDASDEILAAFDRLRLTYPPGKRPDWRADAVEKHGGRLLRLLRGAEPWPEAWAPPAPTPIAAAGPSRPPLASTWEPK